MSKDERSLSRRSFLKWSAAAAALSGGLTACGSGGGDETVIAGGGGPQDTPEALLSGGKWVVTQCPGCSKFWCINQVYVVDGIPIRQKTQDDHEFTLAYPQYRSCIKGRSSRWWVFNPARLKYPMKRKNWQPGGGANSTPHLRGKDEWEIISWDDAIRFASTEFKRVCEADGGAPYAGAPWGNYGNNGGYAGNTEYGKDLRVLNLTYCADMEPRFLNYLGYGSMPMYGQNSTGGWPVVRNKIVGSTCYNSTYGSTSGVISADWRDIAEKAKVIVQWGMNPTWSQYGATQLAFRAAKENGAKIYCVDPWFNPGNNAWADEWIPVRPGTDNALLLAIAWVLIDENLVNESFLFNNTLGYDADHMPMYDRTGAELTERIQTILPNGTTSSSYVSIVEAHRDGTAGKKQNKYYKLNFKDYVLGTYDGVVKNPEWATSKCGTPVAKIYELARAVGNIAKNGDPREELVFFANQSTGRHYHGATMAQTFYTVSWMLGGPIGSSFGGGDYSGFVGGYHAPNGRYFKEGAARHHASYTRDYVGPYTFSSGRANPKAAGSYGNIMNPQLTIEDNYDESYFYGVAFAEVPRAVNERKFHNFVYGEEDADIRGMIKLHNSDQPNQNVNIKGYIDAMRNPRVEIVVAADLVMSTATRYADIIFPAASLWESDGFYSVLNPEAFVANPHPVVQPLFQAKTDYEMQVLLCKAVGATNAEAKSFCQPLGQTVHDHVMAAMMDITVASPSGGAAEYLLKFDDDDLNEIGAETSLLSDPALGQGRISYKEFKQKGYYQVRVNNTLRETIPAGLSDFLAEAPTPDGTNSNWIKKTNILGTQTGFYEIFSIGLYNYYQNFWFDAARLSLDAAVDESATIAKRSQLLYPIAKYRIQPDGYEDTLDGKYPLQYIDVHPHHRVHSSRSDSPNVLDTFDDVLFIHPNTANAYGLKHGDTAILTSSNGGRIMRRVCIKRTVMPGVIVGTEGSKVRFLDDEATAGAIDWANAIDYGGAANTLTASHLVGQAHQAYNTVIVNIERAAGKLLPQYKWQPDVPEAARTVVSNYYK
jgi:anaerobic dimethyl sulfoxide reductase subunit A